MALKDTYKLKVKGGQKYPMQMEKTGTLPAHPVTALCHGHPVALGLQDCPPPSVRQQITDGVDLEWPTFNLSSSSARQLSPSPPG